MQIPSPGEPIEHSEGNERTERKLVLLVEDDLPVADFMSDLLRSEPNWEVVTFNEAGRALSFLQHILPDLIVLDLILPGMDGLEFYDHLKANSATSSIPVLFVTAVLDISGLAARNITTVVSKPFDIDEFLSAVMALLGMKE